MRNGTNVSKKVSKIFLFILLAVLTSVLAIGFAGCGFFSTDTDDAGTPGTDGGKGDDVQAVEDEDLSDFEDTLNKRLGGDVLIYGIQGNEFYCYTVYSDRTVLNSVLISNKAEMSTKDGLKTLTEDILSSEPSVLCEFDKDSEFFDYGGLRYNSNGIRGNNVFADKVGVSSTQAVTVVGKPYTKIVSGEYITTLSVGVVTEDKTVLAEIKYTYSDKISGDELYDGLLSGSASVEKEEISLGLTIGGLKADLPEVIEEEPADPDVTEEDILEFENLLTSKVGDVLKYESVNGTLVVCSEDADDLKYSFYQLKEGEGLKKKSQIEKLTRSVENDGLETRISLPKVNSDEFIYENYRYGYNVKGINPFDETAGDDTVTAIIAITLTEKPYGGFEAKAEMVVGEGLGTSLVVITAPCVENASIAGQITALTGTSAEKSTSYIIGGNHLTRLTAERRVNVEETVERPSTAQDIADFGIFLDGQVVGTLLGWEIKEDGTYRYLQTYEKTAEGLLFSTITLSEGQGTETNFRLNALRTFIDEEGLSKYLEVKSTGKIYEYEGYNYNGNSLGISPLFPDAASDFASSIITIGYTPSAESPTGYYAVAKVVAEENGALKLFEFKAESPSTQSIKVLLDNLKNAVPSVTTITDKVSFGQAGIVFETRTVALDKSTPTEEQIAEFESVLETKIDGTMLGYKIENGKLELWENEADRVACYQYVLGENEGIDMVYKLDNLKQNLDLRLNTAIPLSSSAEYSYTLDNTKYTFNANTIGEDLFGLFTDNDSKSYTIIEFNATYAVAKVYVQNGPDTKLYEIRADYRQGTSQEDAIEALLLADKTLVSESVLPGVNILANLNCERMQTEIIQTPTDPEETLDFSALEAKLEEISEVVKPYYTLKEILSYSIKDGNIYLVLDAQFMNNNKITVYKSTNIYDFSNQSKINEVVNSITKDDFVEVSDVMKAKSNITVDGVEYSKDGIDGDNPFARRCGITNAVKTYVSNISKPMLDPSSATHYSSGYNVLVVFEENGETKIRLQGIGVECIADATQEEILGLSFSGQSYVGGELVLSEPINLGENMKNEQSQTPTDPEETLDFSALEEKLEEVILAKHRGIKINEIISYSINNGEFYVLYDTSGSAGSSIRLMVATTEYNFETQENVNAITNTITKDDFSSGVLIGKSKSNITVDGVEYSKDGIDGDNPFARRCGITNAVKTYVSGLGVEGFANTGTGYGKGIKILVLSEANGEFKVTKAEFVAESRSDYTDEQVYKNALIDNDIEKSYLNSEMQIVNLGENMKNEQSQPPTDPEETLDFSALEAKLEEVILAKHRGIKLNEIISYSVVDGKLMLMYDICANSTGLSGIYLQELSINVNDLNSQENINNVAENLSKSSFASSPLATIIKTSSNITVDGVEYSKDGIDGDNPFARQCGIENAVKTYVSGCSPNGPSTSFMDGASCTVEVVVVEKEEDNLIVTKVKFMVSGRIIPDQDTQNHIYKNLTLKNVEGEKMYNLIKDQSEYLLGENMKK